MDKSSSKLLKVILKYPKNFFWVDTQVFIQSVELPLQ